MDVDSISMGTANQFPLIGVELVNYKNRAGRIDYIGGHSSVGPYYYIIYWKNLHNFASGFIKLRDNIQMI